MTPTLPELWDTAAAAAYLKVSTTRVRQIKNRADFPAPVYHLNGGDVWLADQVSEFDDGWDRTIRPGRPRTRTR